MSKDYYFKWYHWFLYPFAKKFKLMDGDYIVYIFYVFGKYFIYKRAKLLSCSQELNANKS